MGGSPGLEGAAKHRAAGHILDPGGAPTLDAGYGIAAVATDGTGSYQITLDDDVGVSDVVPTFLARSGANVFPTVSSLVAGVLSVDFVTDGGIAANTDFWVTVDKLR